MQCVRNDYVMIVPLVFVGRTTFRLSRASSSREIHSLNLCKTMDLPTWWGTESRNILRPTKDQRKYHCIIIAYSLHFSFDLLCFCFDLVTLQTSCQRSIYVVDRFPSSKKKDYRTSWLVKATLKLVQTQAVYIRQIGIYRWLWLLSTHL